MQLLLIVFILLGSLLSASELDFEADLLQSLDEVSEIATKTKLNIDDTPSFVTVLHSQKLQKLGIDNVFEALGLVPGVQLKKEKTGVPVVVFRGVTQKGEVKLMIDGVSINNSYRGSIYHYLDFPIEMIKRIEVIRGAGSVLYGSGAISGVINIITQSSDESFKNIVFISGGSYNTTKGGALVSTDIGELKLALDSYYQKNDKIVKVEPNPSPYDGDSDRHLKDYSVGLNLSGKHLSFLGRVKKSDMGNAYGAFGILDEEKNKYNNINTSIFTQLSYKRNFSENNKISALVGYNRYEQQAKSLHPAGIVDADYKEESYFFQTDFISTFLTNNEFLIGAKFESAKTLKSEWSLGSVAITPISNPYLTRKITSIYLNNTYSLNSDTAISAGLRYDSYSDFGDSYSPNLGLVYRFNEFIRVKTLYSHSFRAPSWVELTSNPDLKAESSDSIEAGIIFKQSEQNIFRINFYASKINDMITKPTGTYIQESKNEFYGAELEYIYSLNHQTELNFFASYIDANDNDGDNLADVANILASTSLSYELNSGFTFGSLLKYISSSKRSTTDIRDDMRESFIFDQTLSYSNKNFTLSLVLKDLFNSGVYYALPKNNYEKDFDDSGRRILLNASLEF
ncbi:MAG: TonB-dependent receptor [Sulfurimonas sp.]|nr:TonB-dependent receptor [Sulfurimonas sp.]